MLERAVRDYSLQFAGAGVHFILAVGYEFSAKGEVI